MIHSIIELVNIFLQVFWADLMEYSVDTSFIEDIRPALTARLTWDAINLEDRVVCLKGFLSKTGGMFKSIPSCISCSRKRGLHKKRPLSALPIGRNAV